MKEKSLTPLLYGMNLDRECRVLFTKSLSSKIKRKSALISIQVNS